VLPFANISAEKDNEYFSEGLTEEIIMNLSKLQMLKVIARGSTTHYVKEGKTHKQTATDLGVQYLLEGSVRRQGRDLRITAQLIDGLRDVYVWSETYRGTMADIFDIQEKVAVEIVQALQLRLSPDEKQNLKKRFTENTGAYQLYLQARYHFNKFTGEGFKRCIECCKKALEIEPNYALAYAALSLSFQYGWFYGHLSFEEKLAAIGPHDLFAEKAVELDPNLAEAHVAIGQALVIQRRFKDAAAEFERAIELHPTLFDAYYFYARSSFEAGDLEKAVQLFEKAHRSRPEDYQATALRALALHELGRADEARQADQQAVHLINKYLEINPNEARAYSLGASPLARLGEREHSKQWSEQAIALAPNDPVILYNTACNLAQLGEHDRALDRLERSIEAGVAVSDWIKHDPDFESLRDHPRFQAIVKRIAPS